MLSRQPIEKQAWTEERRYFESDGRPLYGVTYRAERPSPTLVLFCNSFSENHCEGRAEAIAARIIAANGYSAFVYHPRAHGDSAGDSEDLTFEDLVDDAVNAATYARSRSGASQIVWVGIRFGAIVAAHAIRRIAGSTALALWEPALNGRDYLVKSMRHVIYSEMSHGERPSLTVDQMSERLKREGKISLLAFDLHRKFFDSAQDADLLDALEAWRSPTLIAQFQKHSRLSRPHNQLRETLVGRGVSVRALLHRGTDGTDPWWAPEEIARQTGDWLDELA
ncbi:serine aminopeptidase domain-containing protein [Candidatus Binatus sp.]|uniref:serine aminopeptidase domain-containing protein n=1 Tax=Candidatus Binatus sp. TaxID=2811406 RepID=UPI003C87599A